MESKISVVGIQIKLLEGDRDYNLNRAADLIEKNAGHDLYVLPELSCSGYGKKTFDQLDLLGEEKYGPSFSFFSEVAKKFNTHICYSFPRKIKTDVFTICSAVVNNEGKLIATYDKLHICQFGECFEKDYFTPGNHLSPVFEINSIKIGLAICYDIRFGELFRKLALEREVTLILHPGGWPRDEAFATWHSFVITRAMENTIYLLSVNCAGENNGASIFCPPFCW